VAAAGMTRARDGEGPAVGPLTQRRHAAHEAETVADAGSSAGATDRVGIDGAIGL
jgi:hypothetical protein